MQDEMERYREAFSQLKEAFKEDKIFGWLYRIMIAMLDTLENILETIGGNRK